MFEDDRSGEWSIDAVDASADGDSLEGWTIPGVSRGLGSDSTPVAAEPVEPSPVVRDLLAAFERLVDRVPSALPGTVALADTAALLVLGERLRAVTLTHVADVDARKLHHDAGAPTTSSWVNAQVSI